MVRAAQDARARGIGMKGKWRRRSWFALAGILCLAMATAASAQVVVTVDGDTAYATISLTDGNGVTYDADVTIVFDTPQHLTPQNLNLTAELVNPADLQDRLAGTCLPQLLLPPLCPSVDPAFPVMITVEPINLPSIYTNSFDLGEGHSVDLSFLNTYQFDVHTHDLVYQDGSPYRLFKAPIDDVFHDVTNDVMPGSVRVRGRGGEFSQFIVVTDPRYDNALDRLSVTMGKITALNLRILSAALSDGLRLDLLDLLAQVDALLLVDLVGAIGTLDELIGVIDQNAGTNIANVWTAERNLINDAGEMDELADTLRFSMTRMLSGSANP